MKNLNSFFVKYKVFLTGLAGAIALSLNQLLSTAGHSDDLKVYAYAALMAGLSFIATQWRGQGMSIFGIVGTLSGVFVTMQQSGNFSWYQFGLGATVALLSVFSPPPKPLTYEHNETIVEAKKIPPVDEVPDTSKLPIGGETIKAE
jgi:hypothetical protein